MYVHVPNSYTYMHNIHFYHINVCMYIICMRGYGPVLKYEDWHVKSFHTPVLAQQEPSGEHVPSNVVFPPFGVRKKSIGYFKF